MQPIEERTANAVAIVLGGTHSCPACTRRTTRDTVCVMLGCGHVMHRQCALYIAECRDCSAAVTERYALNLECGPAVPILLPEVITDLFEIASRERAVARDAEVKMQTAEKAVVTICRASKVPFALWAYLTGKDLEAASTMAVHMSLAIAVIEMVLALILLLTVDFDEFCWWIATGHVVKAALDSFHSLRIAPVPPMHGNDIEIMIFVMIGRMALSYLDIYLMLSLATKPWVYASTKTVGKMLFGATVMTALVWMSMFALRITRWLRENAIDKKAWL
jgi:hypothetical protein